jgi:SAM-dependent methyltransferase
MDYESYVEMQVYGEVIKPIHYHIGEYLAMTQFFTVKQKTASVLDVGCGIGYGVGMLKKIFGFSEVTGVDLNPKKIEIGHRLGYNIVCADIMDIYDDSHYDVIWCSHAFEHMFDPYNVIQRLKQITKQDARIIFILPYPDINPSPIHCAAPIIGTNIQDNAETLVRWFESRGLFLVDKHYSSFRESEVWLEFGKK